MYLVIKFCHSETTDLHDARCEIYLNLESWWDRLNANKLWNTENKE